MFNFFNPKTIALIGASNEPGSVGLGISKNLLESSRAKHGRRKIFFVNPNRKKILGRKTFPSILDIKDRVDLAIIAVPAKIAAKLVSECAEKKTKAVIVISAGFAETGRQGKELQDCLLKNLNLKNRGRSGLPLLGPNCLGIVSPGTGLNASFAPAMPQQGNIAFISQSGALIDGLIDYSLGKNFGFSAMVSCGNQADLDVSDLLRFFGQDKQTKVIALYIEGLKQGSGQKFIKTARQVSKHKPIVALKGGQTKKSAKAVCSHTGVLAGTSEIYSAAFEQAGIYQVETLTELILAVRVLSKGNNLKGRVGIITNAGAVGVLITDWCQKLGLPALAPLDLLGDAQAEDYQKAIDQLLERKDIGGLIVAQTMQIMTDSKQNARVIVKAQKKHSSKPVLALFLGGKLTAKGIKILDQALIPCFNEPKQAALAMKALLWKTKFSK